MTTAPSYRSTNVSARASSLLRRAWAAARRSAARPAAAARRATVLFAAARPWLPGGAGDVTDAMPCGQASAAGESPARSARARGNHLDVRDAATLLARALITQPPVQRRFRRGLVQAPARDQAFHNLTLRNRMNSLRQNLAESRQHSDVCRTPRSARHW